MARDKVAQAKKAKKVCPELALEKLGRGTTQIAASLRRKGFKGEIVESRECPLAMYLRSLPGVSEARVGSDKKNEVWVTYRFRLSAGAAKFVEKFDRGEYPELVVGDKWGAEKWGDGTDAV